MDASGKSRAAEVDGTIIKESETHWKRLGCILQLSLERFHMIFVNMCISQHMNKVTWHQIWCKNKNMLPISKKIYADLGVHNTQAHSAGSELEM
jgi:hypothetical protein